MEDSYKSWMFRHELDQELKLQTKHLIKALIIRKTILYFNVYF